MDKVDLQLCLSHIYPLNYTNSSSKCVACYEYDHDNKQGYECNFCNTYVHEACINVNIPSRHKHPLKLKKRYDPVSEKHCSLCSTGCCPELLYYCLRCSFRICVPCARKPLIFNQIKAHEHELLQVPIELSFTCHACGLHSTHDYPCLCVQCCFIIHRECMFLPRVIYINRHDHRISHVYSLGPGKWICGVCYEPVNGEYGAYSCSVCSYVVHSRCATKEYIWDGRELEGEPEEDEIEEIKPFQVIDQNLIKHFSHEHNLKVSLSSSRLEEPREHCYACTLPFYSELCYKCTQCDFILHDACANLPMKKRHEISVEKLVLSTTSRRGDNFEVLFTCVACRRYCNGFAYNNAKYLPLSFDVRCASVSYGIKHESHPHMLFVFLKVQTNTDVRCESCDLVCWFYLCCKGKDDCGGYNLCFTCATFPTLVRHKYDDHPLSLCYGEKNVNATYCCGICEEEVYSKSWFYKCNECCSTLHTKCVFNNLIHSRTGDSSVMVDKGSFDLLPNNRLSRPICNLCKTRCVGDLVLNKKADKNLFICCACAFSGNYFLF